MRLDNTILDPTNLLSECHKKLPAPKNPKKPPPNALDILQGKIKKYYFHDQTMTNNDALIKLDTDAFRDFPYLQKVLKNILNGITDFEINKEEENQDWHPQVSFSTLNEKYGYFNDDLSALHNRLAIACRKMTSIIEHKAYDDAMAYKLMVLFYDANKSNDENFQHISESFDRMMNTNQDKPISHPYHDALAQSLRILPEFKNVINLQSWKSFINNEGFKGLSIFSQFAEMRPGFNNMNTALLVQKYEHAEECLKLAEICYNIGASDDGFIAGLALVKTGWPKKESDNLPVVDIADETGRYFWIKLPPQDMRAMYLGNAIPRCCQFINGASHQCVKDGIYLSDNGFYVLLKAKKAQSHPPRILEHEINTKCYDIVAQSYAWKSNNGNLCLDSIEWYKDRVNIGVIQELISKFSDKVFAEHPNIKHITVGQNGQTPRQIFSPCRIIETMKQGFMYGDSHSQYSIASNISDYELTKLKKRLKKQPQGFKDTVLYMAPYFKDLNHLPEALLNINPNLKTELPNLIKCINLPPKLDVDDFKKISFEDYQRLDISDQSGISTARKIFNSMDEEELIKWLPSIPKEELSQISFRGPYHSIPFLLELVKQCQPEQRLDVLKSKTENNEAILFNAASNPEALRNILELLTPEQVFEALRETNSEGESILFVVVKVPQSLKIILECLTPEQAIAAIQEKSNKVGSILFDAVYHPQSLKMILDLYPVEKRRKVLQEKNKDGESLLHIATSKPESLKMILDLYPVEERIKAVNQQNIHGESILLSATSCPASLKMILDLYTPEERLKAVQEHNSRNSAMIIRAIYYPESLKMILDLYTPEERLKAIYQCDAYGESILYRALSNPESLKMILEHIPAEDRLKVIYQRNSYEESFLFRTLSNPKSLKMILDLYPPEERLKAVHEKNRMKSSLLWEAAAYPESLKMVLDLYRPEERLKAVEEEDEDNLSVLFKAISKPESVRIILEVYPEDKRQQVIEKKHINTPSLLLKAFSYPESLKIILELYPRGKLLALFDDISLLCNAARKPESLKMILEHIPAEDRLKAVDKKSSNGDSLLYQAISTPESAKMILELYSKEDGLKILKETNWFGKSPLSKAIENPESFKLLLEIYSAEKILEAIKEINSTDAPLLFTAASTPESFKMILDLYPAEERTNAVEEKNRAGESILFAAIKSPESLQMIFDLYPEDILKEVINIKNNNNQSLLSLAIYYEESFEMILEHYPEDKRLEALIEKNKDTKSVLSKACESHKLLKTILELISPTQLLEVLKEKNSSNFTIFEVIYREYPNYFKLLLKRFPEEIAYVLNERKQDIDSKPNEVLESVLSIEQFMKNMQGLAQPEAIKNFIRAIVKNENFEVAKEHLFTTNHSHSFFQSDNKEAITKNIEKLNVYWLPQSPFTERAPSQPTARK